MSPFTAALKRYADTTLGFNLDFLPLTPEDTEELRQQIEDDENLTDAERAALLADLSPPSPAERKVTAARMWGANANLTAAQNLPNGTVRKFHLIAGLNALGYGHDPAKLRELSSADLAALVPYETLPTADYTDHRRCAEGTVEQSMAYILGGLIAGDVTYAEDRARLEHSDEAVDRLLAEGLCVVRVRARVTRPDRMVRHLIVKPGVSLTP